MNIVKVYDTAAGRLEVPDVVEIKKKEAISQAEKADASLAITNWKQHPETQKFFASIVQEANQLETEARELASVYQDNPQTIINKLVQSSTLRKVVSYAA